MSTSSQGPTPQKQKGGARIPWLWLAIFAYLVIVTAGVWFAWQHFHVTKHLEPDMVEVLRLNNAGVGHMEYYQYDLAIADFEEVVRIAPNWIPGHINLGIALFNKQGNDQELLKKKGQSAPAQSGGSNMDRAIKIFKDVLQQTDNDPKLRAQRYDLYAHYCLGIILRDQSQLAEAEPHFKAVTEGDPNDPGGWVWYGFMHLQFERPDEAMKCFERSIKLDPYNLMALNNLQLALRRQGNDAQANALLQRFEKLESGKAGRAEKTEYGKMGKYADVIGRVPDLMPIRTGPLPMFLKNDKFQVKLANGARWATAQDFGSEAVADLRRAVRARFGACIVTLDYNGDGKPDLFLLGAVVQDGHVRDLLLRNDGDYHFTDVTKEAGLAEPWPSLGCCVGDLDNDGKPDLVLTGAGGLRVFRNNGKGGFDNVTTKAGLDTLTSVCLGATLVDLDQDGDLDLLVAQFADKPQSALAAFTGEKRVAGSEWAVFINKSIAPPGPANAPAAPLELHFARRDETAKHLKVSGPAVGAAVGDFDKDRDLDLVLLGDQAPPAVAVNDRLLEFRSLPLPDSLASAANWNGALVFDANHDERSDLFLIGPGQRPVLLLNRQPEDPEKIDQWFEAGATNSPPLLQAQVVDIDLDGWLDIVGMSEKRVPVLLHNDGKRLVYVESGLGSEADWPPDLAAVLTLDVDGDCYPDVILWSEKDGLQLRSNQKNANHALLVQLTGTRNEGNKMRCNADAFGTWVVAQSSDLWTGQELTTLSAGLGQSRQPLILGLGKYTQADVLRLRWPDGTLQAELNLPECQITRVPQVNRESISCPILFTWNGRRFEFVTDFLGAGSLGEYGPDGSTRPPRPEESVKIEADQLVPRNGHYTLKIAQPMDEATYIDRLQLLVVDHPADVRVYPDERFVDAEPYPSQDLLALRPEIFPVKARDHHGHDVTEILRRRDRITVDDFAFRSWLGYAEDHWVELDFGNRLAKFGDKDRLMLCLAGWTDYPYPESIWAATQAGVAMQAPLLERLGDDGKWQPIAEIGFPAGLPRMMTFDATGKLGGAHCVVRLRSNMQVYWDQIFVAPLVQSLPARHAVGKPDDNMRATRLDATSATLSPKHCMRAYSPDGRKPTIYDYDMPEAVPVERLIGKLTKFGDVTELLNAADDCFVIFGPGDELTVNFDATKLPDLPPGWTRDFVLRTWGYCKDCAPFTATGATIEPLPFRAMENYPPKKSKYPEDALHDDYRRRYNTRHVGKTRN